MSRPTDSVKSKVIKVRVDEELESRIRGRGDNLSESIRNLIEVGLKNPVGNDFVPQNKTGENTLQNSFVPQLGKEESIILKDIESMVKCTGGTLKEFLDDLDLKLTMETLPLKEGVIDLNRLETDMELEGILKNLEDACEEKGVSMIEALKRTIQGVFNG